MSLIRIQKNPSRRQLLVFAIAWLVFFGISGGVCWIQGRHGPGGVLLALACAVPVVGAMAPSVLRIAYLGLSYATYPLGFVVSYVVLGFVYYLVLTPIGLMMRLLGRDPLERRFDPKAKSYWAAREPEKSVDSYFNQS